MYELEEGEELGLVVELNEMQFDFGMNYARRERKGVTWSFRIAKTGKTKDISKILQTGYLIKDLSKWRVYYQLHRE